VLRLIGAMIYLQQKRSCCWRVYPLFSGGWTLDAAEKICAADERLEEGIEEWEVLDLLTSLTDQSLI